METFKIAERLFGVWGSSIITSINIDKIPNKIKTAYIKRNAVGHGVWVRMKKGDYRLRLVREKRPTEVGDLDRRIMPQFKKLPLSVLNADAKFIVGVGTEIRQLIQDVRGSLKTWPKTNPARPPPRWAARRERRTE